MYTGKRKSTELKRHLRRGKVYRREDLTKYSNSIDRHLEELQQDGTLEKVGPGLYYYPKKSPFGNVPPDDKELVRSFLKDDKFLITSPNAYNSLGVGTTQLYNKKVVYNRSRHGIINIGGKTFEFKSVKDVPSKVTREYLVVDLLNNLEDLAEDHDEVKKSIVRLARHLNPKSFRTNVRRFGKVRTKKFLEKELAGLE